MRVTQYITNIKSRADKIILIPLGDIHLGGNNVDMEKLTGFIKYIKETPNVYWVGMGDYLDAINLSDVRFDPSTLAPWCRDNLDDLVNVQAEYFVNLVAPIADRCLGLLEGNHEEKIRLRYHVDMLSWVAKELNVPLLSSMAMIKWRFRRPAGADRSKGGHARAVVIWLAHGWDASRTEGAPINNVVAAGRDYDADIYLMGHCHRKITADRERFVLLGAENPYVYSFKRLYVRTGSFMLANHDGKHSGYAERRCFPPIPTGAVKIIIEPFRAAHYEGSSVDLPPHIHVTE